MVNRNLLREFHIDDDELNASISAAAPEIDDDEFDVDSWLMDNIADSPDFSVNEIVKGTILGINGDSVSIDIGAKSEGSVPLHEWNEDEDPPEPGGEVEVLLEEVEDEFGLILLSKRKADILREWNEVTGKHDEGDVVTGEVIKKIKGGLLVDIGVSVFLPASQVDIRRPPDIGDYIGQTIDCMILKIDDARRNIVVSRRKLIEEQRATMKEELLKVIEEGMTRKGVVKNIADFGAFVDLGGIDGLLHITDMSYDRIGHPSEMVKIDDEIEVKILNIDREREKIALGLKQLLPDPWEHVQNKYPVGSKHPGEVVNVMTYGAFVKLEAGIEGLVHISEMSWTKRINHPNDMVSIGDEVDVVVLGINMDKQEISLGMKQTQPNPWDNVSEKYPEGTRISGTVRNLTNYGAFVELEEGVDGLLHVSDMSWTRKLSHANEMLKKGDQIDCVILNVDQERKRIALGLKQLEGDPWATDIPDRYAPGNIVTGKITKITNFGVFVELEEGLEGLLHVSELSDEKIESPDELVDVGQDIQVRVLRIDMDDRKIGLSRKLEPTEEDLAAEAASANVVGGTGPSTGAASKELRGGTGGGSGPLFSLGGGGGAAEESTDAEAETATDESGNEGDES